MALELASQGFADTTRVGGGNPDLGRDMAENNREAIIEGIKSYQKKLEELEKILVIKDWKALQSKLQNSQQVRRQFIN